MKMLLMCAVLLTAPLQAAIRMVDAGWLDLPLAAGGQIELGFDLYNDSDVVDSVDLRLVRSDIGSQSYLLTDASVCPRGSLITPTELNLLPRQTLQCRYHLQRPASVQADASFTFLLFDPETGSSVQSRHFQVGDLTRLALSYRWLRFAAAGQPAQIQVTLRNQGPTAVTTVAYAGCAHLGVQSAVRVIAGDCSSAGAFCFTGQLEHGFQIRDIAVGSSKSCVLEWDPTSTAVGFELGLSTLAKPQGAALLNTNPAAARVRVAGVPAPLQLPARGALGLLILVALVGTVAVARCGQVRV